MRIPIPREHLFLYNIIGNSDNGIQYIADILNNHKNDTGAPPREPLRCSKFKAIACLLFLESCLESSLLILVAWLAEKSEHILLVSLNTGLVERIYGEEVT